IRWLPGSVRPMEVDPVGHKQDGSCALPDRLEPLCFSACVEQCDSVAMLGETGDPVTHLVAVKWRIEVDETLAWPRALQAVGCPVDLRAVPRTRIGGARIELERPDRVDDPLRGDVVL